MFVGDVATLDSPIGALELGVVDAQLPGVAEGISRLLTRSIQDAREETGGHLPSWLVDEIMVRYTSAHSVRTLWAAVGDRFALATAATGEILGTIHVARDPEMILTVDRDHINVPARDYPDFKPDAFHHVVNISVKHEIRRLKLGSLMVDAIVSRFGRRFAGRGLWVRADPPWHAGLFGLRFAHDPARDVFLPATAQRTAGLPHAQFNARYTCDCAIADGARAWHARAMASEKLQYVSMARPFELAARVSVPRSAVVLDESDEARAACATTYGGARVMPRAVARPATLAELAAVVGESRQRHIAIRGAGYSWSAQPLGDDLVIAMDRMDRVGAIEEDHVVVEAGAPFAAVVRAAAARGLAPPVIPGIVVPTVGGILASGGLGKGSHVHGLVADHVRELVVVTGDGRVVACSPTQAAWLFDAVLGGHGRFGVIARATLALAPCPPRVRVESTAHASIADAALSLGDDGVHAMATIDSNGRALAIRAVAGDDLVFAEYACPPAPTPLPSRLARRNGVDSSGAATLAQVLASRDELPAVLATLAPDPGDSLYVHPVRRPASARGLCLDPRSGFVVSLITSRPRAIAAWRRVDDDRIVAAQRLADPAGVFVKPTDRGASPSPS